MTLDKLARIMVEGFEEVKTDIAGIKSDMTEVKRDIAEIKGDLKAHGKAIDKDAVTLINHETRIKKLEHAR
ncbi:MAG TPA: hypothetical protein VJJ02_00945 [Candidatus Paceibacterota bacterium]